jgi:Protein of unknown function (DUF2924)
MVLIHADGIEWRGQRYRSLSVVARKITGARWSGPRFFGLRRRRPDSYSIARTGHASNPCGLSICAGRAAWIRSPRRILSRARRRHSSRRPQAAGPRLSVSLGTQSAQPKNWHALNRDGLVKTFPHYAAQVLIYQSYLAISENPALFTALNADSCERLHLLVPFNAIVAQHWIDRAVAVIEATRAGELLPRFTDDPEDWRCGCCGHKKRCWHAS